jgi:capsular polysaccharide biosynthesis protein
MIEPVRADPVPVKPNIPLLLKLALGLGLVLSVGFGFLVEMLDHRLKSKLDAEEFLGVPVMASLDYYEAPVNGRNGNGKKHHEIFVD